jgi:hypothetical protein
LIVALDKKYVLWLEIGVDEIEVVKDYKALDEDHALLMDHLQATLVNSWRANSWMWVFGKGVKVFAFKKSNTLCPYKSVTMQM